MDENLNSPKLNSAAYSISKYLETVVFIITLHYFNKYKSNVYSLEGHDIYEVKGFHSNEQIVKYHTRKQNNHLSTWAAQCLKYLYCNLFQTPEDRAI